MMLYDILCDSYRVPSMNILRKIDHIVILLNIIIRINSFWPSDAMHFKRCLQNVCHFIYTWICWLAVWTWKSWSIEAITQLWLVSTGKKYPDNYLKETSNWNKTKHLKWQSSIGTWHNILSEIWWYVLCVIDSRWSWCILGCLSDPVAIYPGFYNNKWRQGTIALNTSQELCIWFTLCCVGVVWYMLILPMFLWITSLAWADEQDGWNRKQKYHAQNWKLLTY